LKLGNSVPELKEIIFKFRNFFYFNLKSHWYFKNLFYDFYVYNFSVR